MMSYKVIAPLVLTLIGGGAVAAVAFADSWTSSQDSSSGTIVSACSFLWPSPLGDDDCDGWTTADESLLGTDPDLACGVGAWAPDFDDSTDVNIFDINLMKPAFFSTAPDPPYDARLDVVPNGNISVLDLTRMKPFFFLSCTP